MKKLLVQPNIKGGKNISEARNSNSSNLLLSTQWLVKAASLSLPSHQCGHDSDGPRQLSACHATLTVPGGDTASHEVKQGCPPTVWLEAQLVLGKSVALHHPFRC